MRCQGCGYALWNLPEPRCPECGRAFDMREYVFRAGTVKFACPECGALRHGRGDRYTPSALCEIVCDACHKTIEVVRMRVVPTVDPPVEAEWRDKLVVPWETFSADDGVHVAAQRWFSTFKLALMSPRVLARRFRESANPSDPFWFASLSWFVGFFVPLLMIAIGGLVLVVATAGAARHGASLIEGLGLYAVMIAIFTFIGLPMAIALAITASTVFVWLPAHLLLFVTGGTRGGLGRTYRAVMYGHAILVWLPVSSFLTPVGWLAVYGWFVFCASRMLSEHQGVPMWRAVLALLVGPAACVFLLAVLMWVR